MNYLFGPVNSRRLGRSLGIDLTPGKVCNFNCIYCEVGQKNRLTCERKEYVPTDAVIREIDEYLAGTEVLPDVFTVTGSGEPTLHSGIGRIIRHLKSCTDIPVVVLTNSSLFYLPEVRNDLLAADIVVPSLDAARQESFEKINRPIHCSFQLEGIIAGLEDFSREYDGEMWLEVLLAKGINDSPEDIAAIRDAVARIRPQRIQLNTVARPPMETFAEPVDQQRIEEAAEELGRGYAGLIEVLPTFSEGMIKMPAGVQLPADEDGVLEMLRRRPCTRTEIGEVLKLDRHETDRIIAKLQQGGRVRETTHNGKLFYQVTDTPKTV